MAMSLFDTVIQTNLLPGEGTVIYFGKVMPRVTADYYLNTLFQNIEWKNEEAFIAGKHITAKIKAGWYGDSNYSYTCFNITKQFLVWTEELPGLKSLCETKGNSSSRVVHGIFL